MLHDKITLFASFFPVIVILMIGPNAAYAQEASVWKYSDITIEGGTLTEIRESSKEGSITLQVEMDKDGYVLVPKTYHISANPDCTANTDGLFVLVDNEEASKQIDKNNQGVRIDVSKDSKKVEIISGHILVLHTYSSAYAVFCKALDEGIHMSPHAQTKTGFLVDDIICKEGMVLIFNTTNNEPTCVKPNSAEKLLDRGYSQESKFSLPFSNMYKLNDGNGSIIRYHLYDATLENVSIIDKGIRFNILPITHGMISVSIPYDVMNDANVDLTDLNYTNCNTGSYSSKISPTQVMYIKSFAGHVRYVDFVCG